MLNLEKFAIVMANNFLGNTIDMRIALRPRRHRNTPAQSWQDDKEGSYPAR
jgi:hypothetical protein